MFAASDESGELFSICDRCLICSAELSESLEVARRRVPHDERSESRAMYKEGKRSADARGAFFLALGVAFHCSAHVERRVAGGPSRVGGDGHAAPAYIHVHRGGLS